MRTLLNVAINPGYNKVRNVGNILQVILRLTLERELSRVIIVSHRRQHLVLVIFRRNLHCDHRCNRSGVECSGGSCPRKVEQSSPRSGSSLRIWGYNSALPRQCRRYRWPSGWLRAKGRWCGGIWSGRGRGRETLWFPAAFRPRICSSPILRRWDRCLERGRGRVVREWRGHRRLSRLRVHCVKFSRTLLFVVRLVWPWHRHPYRNLTARRSLQLLLLYPLTLLYPSTMNLVKSFPARQRWP